MIFADTWWPRDDRGLWSREDYRDDGGRLVYYPSSFWVASTRVNDDDGRNVILRSIYI